MFERKSVMEQFEDIYEKYYRKIYLFLLKLSGSQTLAEELTIEHDSGKNVEEDVLEQQLRDLMRREIMHLPEPYVSVCTLRIYAELPYAEIASTFGKSESWAKVTFFRGKAMLLERMEKYR